MWRCTSLCATQLKCLEDTCIHLPTSVLYHADRSWVVYKFAHPIHPFFFIIMQITVITMTKCVIVRQCLSRDISWDIHETSCPWDELPMRRVAHDTSCPWHKSLTLPSNRFILRHSWDESLMTQVLQTSPSKRKHCCDNNTQVFHLISSLIIHSEVAIVTILWLLLGLLLFVEWNLSKEHPNKEHKILHLQDGFHSTGDSMYKVNSHQ